MSALEHQDASHCQRDLVNSAWQKIRTYLETEKHRIYQEIRNYPRPIPACDQHFNYLLEKRSGISEELERMDDAIQECSGSDSLERIQAFIKSSRYIDLSAEQAFGLS